MQFCQVDTATLARMAAEILFGFPPLHSLLLAHAQRGDSAGMQWRESSTQPAEWQKDCSEQPDWLQK